MSLNLSTLEKVRHLANGGVEARCPACAEGGHDRTGEHLLIRPDGRFGCCAHPKDREHRKRIFALAGDTSPRSIKVKTPAVKVAAAAVKSGVLGRLGRVFASPPKPETTTDASDGVNEVCSMMKEVRTPRTGSVNSVQSRRRESRTLRTPQYSSTCREKNGDDDVCIEIEGVPVGASEASELVPPAVESEQGVRGVRLPHFTPGGNLVIPFDSSERFHWWKSGQSVAETRGEVESWIRETAGKDGNALGV